MAQDILITPGSGEPQILFRGSGVNDTTIDLNVISSHQSATGSGTALSFEGTEGQLFGVTDNLSSGTIFSVSDIVGLPLIEADASGDVKIGEYGRYVGIGSGIAPAYGLDVFSSGHFHKGFILASYTPATTTNALYNVGGTLTFNGSTVGGTSDEATYASGQAIANETDIVATSGIANYASGQAITNKANIATNTSNISTNTSNISTNTTNITSTTAVANYASGEALSLNAASGQAVYASGNTSNITFGSNLEGDILYHNGTSFTRLAKGTDNHVLTMDGNVPNWEASSGGGGGDITSVTAGGGLNGGGTSGAVTLNVEVAQTGITSLLATDIKIGEDNETKIDFGTPNQIHFYAANVEQVYLADNIFGPQSDSDVDLGTTGVRWKDAYVDSITVTGEVDGASLDISGDADIDGTTNLDAVDIDGNVQLDGTLTVGVDDTGYDVKLFGATASSYLEWDESEDRLNLVGGAYVNEAVPANDTPTVEDATVTLDLKKGNYHNISLNVNVTKFEFTNAKRGQRFILRITQRGSSVKTVVWTNVDSDTGGTAATVRWAGNIKPTMSTSTSHTDVYGFLCTNNAGSEFDAFIIGQDLPD